MTPLVSTSRSKSGRGLLVEVLAGAAVQVRVVGCAVLPAAPDDPHPGAGEDAGGVLVVLAGGSCPVVDISGPGAGGTGGRGAGRDRHAQAVVAGPAERHAAV